MESPKVGPSNQDLPTSGRPADGVGNGHGQVSRGVGRVFCQFLPTHIGNRYPPFHSSATCDIGEGNGRKLYQDVTSRVMGSNFMVDRFIVGAELTFLP